MISAISNSIDEETDKEETMKRKHQRERSLIRQYQLGRLFDQFDEDGTDTSNLNNRVFEREVERRWEELADQQVRRSRLRCLKHQIKKMEKEMKQEKKVTRRPRGRTWQKVTGIGKSIRQLIHKKT